MAAALGFGTHTIELIVTNSYGLSATDTLAGKTAKIIKKPNGSIVTITVNVYVKT